MCQRSDLKLYVLWDAQSVQTGKCVSDVVEEPSGVSTLLICRQAEMSYEYFKQQLQNLLFRVHGSRWLIY